ncbi:sperm-associated antigen 8 [Thalassophryne amazonica]|uniref:sperm-associated antigen 8 n=1 Tax=Thalassophryne amazonica TaxID=390379 RepID=UPI001471BFEF|nr:sperm-associated antigen 8 [Thalassophryne amazonica]XP_034048708.1 sperm-associated antigen 8 [Thalassophryne amazonica]
MSAQAVTVENTADKTNVLMDQQVQQRGSLKNHLFRVEAPDNEKTKPQIQRDGPRGVFMTDPTSKMESVSTLKASYVPPKGPGVRLQGIRGELREKHLTQMISEKLHAEMNAPPPKTDFTSTFQKDFCIEGFVPVTPKTTQVHDYKNDPAVTFWSENLHRIQGVTTVKNLKAPFRKSATFSTPISEQLDEIEVPPDN